MELYWDKYKVQSVSSKKQMTLSWSERHSWEKREGMVEQGMGATHVRHLLETSADQCLMESRDILLL